MIIKLTAVTRNLHKKGYILKTQAPIGYLDLVEANIFDSKKLEELVSKTDVYYLIGILYENGKANTFENIHTKFPKKLAEICKTKKSKFNSFICFRIRKGSDSKYALSKISGK